MAIKKTRHHKQSTDILDCRQLALKSILNLTYGLTAANFSGYLPCVEIADTIVCIARQMLSKVIDLIAHSPAIQQFQPQVVYGDTDRWLFCHAPPPASIFNSVFIKMANRCSLEQAFTLIQPIVTDINALFAQPIAIKFEKVTGPWISAKSQYLGVSTVFFTIEKALCWI